MASKQKKALPSPMQIVADQWASWRTSTLAAAVELDVFTAIDRGECTPAEVASHAKADESATRRLLDALVAMKYLTRRGDRYALAPFARTYLSRDSELFMEGYDQVARMLSMGWQQLTQVVRSGRPIFGDGAAPAPGDFFAVLVKTIFPQNYVGAKAVARGLPPAARRRIKNILDIGGGAGAWSISIAEEIPGSRVTVVDLPEVTAVTGQYAERYGVADRFEYREGNFREVEFGNEQFDLAILGHIFHGEGVQWGKHLLARCAAALRSKGMLLIAELIPNEDRSGPVTPLLFDLNMMIHTPEGGTYTMREYRQWLKDAGFGAIRTIKSAAAPSPLILAVKP
jgi:2-polyprenyl-3-methyl-5-hydroxy-6-metoxy-1,4-benzoquinol methylase